MAQSSTQAQMYVTVGSATQSDYLALPPGSEWKLQFTCGAAFVLDVQESGSSLNFADAYYDATNKVTIDSSTGPQSVVVVGGQNYRMDVSTYNSTITMTAHKV